MRSRILAVLCWLVVLGRICSAADFWEKKNYKEWSKPEAQRLLENSPWAQQVTLGSVNVNVSQRNLSSTLAPGSLGAADVARENTPQITYTVQLRSARIVRQAVIRMSQIDVKYDRMSPEQRARFDAKAQGYVDANDDSVAAYVTFATNVPSLMIDLHSFWSRQTTDLLKNTTFLNAGGQKLPLLEFIVSGDHAFQMIFPRPTNLSPDGTLAVEFQGTGVSGRLEKVLAEFKLKKMVVEGKPQF